MPYKIYNELHAVVRSNSNFINKWIDFFYKKYPKEVQERIKLGVCLDAGCGGTVKGVSLINKFHPAKVYACDINEDHRALYREQGSTTFICCDITSLVFKNDIYDFVLCNGVAHHTPDPWKAVRELHRVLKPGGKIHISVYCFKNSPFYWFVIFIRAISKIFPFRVAKSLSGNNFLGQVILDHAYVPYEFVYNKIEFTRGLQDIGIIVDCILNVSESHRNEIGVGFLARHENVFFGDGKILSFIGHKAQAGA